MTRRARAARVVDGHQEQGDSLQRTLELRASVVRWDVLGIDYDGPRMYVGDANEIYVSESVADTYFWAEATFPSSSRSDVRISFSLYNFNIFITFSRNSVQLIEYI